MSAAVSESQRSHGSQVKALAQIRDSASFTGLGACRDPGPSSEVLLRVTTTPMERSRAPDVMT